MIATPIVAGLLYEVRCGSYTTTVAAENGAEAIAKVL